MSQRAESRYIVWINYGNVEGWAPFPCDTVTDVLNTLHEKGMGQGFEVTAPVQLTALPVTFPPLPGQPRAGSGGEQ